MKIAVDAMGGDHGPGVIVDGALAARREFDVDIMLVGDEKRVAPELERLGARDVELVHASEEIAMDDSPSLALRRKRDSSIRVALDLVAKDRADGMISAGNTGAVMAIAAHVLGRVPTVDRPAIVTTFPTSAGRPAALLDGGANVDCRPSHLVQFALMGAIYARVVLGRELPRVGMLSNGAEPSKGTDVTREANRVLTSSAPAGLMDYTGYIEGRDVFAGNLDVIVCDGFVGNIVLKACEGLADAARTLVQRELAASWTMKLGLAIARPGLKRVMRSFDHREQGGAPLLGVGGACIVAHGSSDALQIRNAIRVAATAASGHIDTEIEDAFKALADIETVGQRAV